MAPSCHLQRAGSTTGAETEIPAGATSVYHAYPQRHAGCQARPHRRPASLPAELVVRAHTNDKFYATRLDLPLRSQNIGYLIITGILPDVCVNCTLLTAANRNYRVTAVTDGMATLWPQLQDACFQIWQRKF